jgi:hypothetical protein
MIKYNGIMESQGNVFHVDVFKIIEIARQFYDIFNRFVIALPIAFMDRYLGMTEDDAVYLGDTDDESEKIEIENGFFGLHEAYAVVEIAVCGEVEVGDNDIAGTADPDSLQLRGFSEIVFAEADDNIPQIIFRKGDREIQFQCGDENQQD